MTQHKLQSRQKKAARRRGSNGASIPSVSRARKSSSGASRSGNSADPKSSFDRYIALARTAAANGNAVDAENYYQHAEHYFRLMKQKTA